MAKPKQKTKREKRLDDDRQRIEREENELKKRKSESKGAQGMTSGPANIFDQLAALLFGKIGDKDAPDSAQKTLPYQKIYKDGLCRVTDTFYSRMIEFDDINYQLASFDSKKGISIRYCALLNSIQVGVSLQITFHNTLIDMDILNDTVRIKRRGNSHLDDVCDGYSKYLIDCLALGRNDLQLKNTSPSGWRPRAQERQSGVWRGLSRISWGISENP